MPNKTCGAEQARAHLPELLDDAHQGSSTIITKHGRPYAALVPVAQATPARRVSSILKLKGTVAGLWGRDSAKTVARLRDEWP
jgi:prevent-host-death family protein